MALLKGALQGNDESSAQEALGMFVELAENDPRFVRKHLSHVVDAMLTIAEHNDLEARGEKLPQPNLSCP